MLFSKKKKQLLHASHACASCLPAWPWPARPGRGVDPFSFSTSADRIDCGVCWYNSAAKSGRSDEEESTLQRQAAGCRDFRAELQRRKADTYVHVYRAAYGRPARRHNEIPPESTVPVVLYYPPLSTTELIIGLIHLSQSILNSGLMWILVPDLIPKARRDTFIRVGCVIRIY